MLAKINLLFFALLVSLSFEQTGHSGPCAITTNPKEYVDCRDKKPGDTRNHVCCYLEANNEAFKRCVEVRKTDLETHDDFDKLRDSIKAGTYSLWLNASNYTGFEEYTNGSFKINSIDSLRCNEAKILKFGKLIILAILSLI